MSAPAGFPKWQCVDGALEAGRYAIEWVPWKDDSRAVTLSCRGRLLEVFPDDVGMIFAAMDAAYEDAQGARI